MQNVAFEKLWSHFDLHHEKKYQALPVYTHSCSRAGSLRTRLGEGCVAHSEGCIWYRPKHHHYYKLKQEEKIDLQPHSWKYLLQTFINHVIVISTLPLWCFSALPTFFWQLLRLRSGAGRGCTRIWCHPSRVRHVCSKTHSQ